MLTTLKNTPLWVYYLLSFPIGRTIIFLFFKETFPDLNLLVVIVGITLCDIIIYAVIKLGMWVYGKGRS